MPQPDRTPSAARTLCLHDLEECRARVLAHGIPGYKIEREVDAGDDESTFQWLIERGQPEGEPQPVWLEHDVMHPATENRWTSDAWRAALFPSQETAEEYIAERGLEARAVEHGFTHEALA